MQNYFSQMKHRAGNITKEAIEKIEAKTGKIVITKYNYKELNLPEKQKELVRETFKKLEKDNLSDFDKNLKKALDHNQKKDKS